MGKKVIALADSSYTIRRIVELSFSEIENVEIKTFDNGSGLMEKLLETKPQIVILDIKLPGINSYDLCKAINQSPELKSTKIYLLKGGFDPIDNQLVQQLIFEEIITKPFDSNNLVNTIMKQFDGEAEKQASRSTDVPSSLPEDFNEIDTEKDASQEINFSDIKVELDAVRMNMSTFQRPVPNSAPDRDEIQPSEEITQGTQTPPSKLDGIEVEDDFSNPFEEPAAEKHAALEIDVPPQKAPTMPEIPMPPSFDFSEFAPKTPARSEEPPVIPHDISKFEAISEEDTSELFADKPLETVEKNTLEEDKFPEEQSFGASATPIGEPIFEFTASAAAKTQIKPEMDDNPPSDPMSSLAYAAFFPEEAESPSFTEISSKKKPANNFTLEEPEILAKPSATPVPSIADIEMEAAKSVAAITPQLAEKQAPKTAQASAPFTIPGAAVSDDILKKAEDKLTIAIKDMLWEIVPSLAEKIIKEEIERIKSEMNFPRT